MLMEHAERIGLSDLLAVNFLWKGEEMKEEYTKEEYTARTLQLRQSLPLDMKIKFSERRIKEWYNAHSGQVYVSFSGGKDSTVLLDLVRSLYPDVPAVFADTGLEYPEIREFVRTIDNVVWVKPKMSFRDVIRLYGLPMISKNVAYYIEQVRSLRERGKTDTATYNLRMTGIKKDGTKASSHSVIPKKWKPLLESDIRVSAKCCDVMKKEPIKRYAKETGRVSIQGIMASEGASRSKTYQLHGCNAFNLKEPQSRPIIFWTEDDIWEYINTKNTPYSCIYDMGEKRTGCVFCMFGCHLEKGENRFQRMAKSHPKLWRYCMEKLELKKALDFIGVDAGEVAS